MRYVQRTRSGWRGWYMRAGKRLYCPVRSTPEAAHADALEARFVAAEDTVAGAMRAVLERARADGRREGTLEWYGAKFAALPAEWGPRRLDSLGAVELQAWADRRALEVGPSTLRSEARAIGRMFRVARLPSPIPLLRLPQEPETVIDPYTRREVVELGELVGPLVLVLFCTGVRRSELAGLEPGDHARGTLTVRHGKRRPRVLPLPPETDALLASWGGVRGDTRRARAGAISRDFVRWRAVHGLDGRFRPHNLRHSLGAHLARCGVSEHLIGTILGHKAASRSMTAHYMAAFGSDVREALAWAWRDPS